MQILILSGQKHRKNLFAQLLIEMFGNLLNGKNIQMVSKAVKPLFIDIFD